MMTTIATTENKVNIASGKLIIRLARITSWILNPIHIPFLAFVVLFLFTYLNMMPLAYKLIVLGIVYCFTILMPAITIFVYRKINKFSPYDINRNRINRFIPYILSVTSYCFCMALMQKLSIPWYMTGIILAALVIQVVCLIVNLKWKLSEHMAGIGGVIGGIVAFSILFGFNPLAWLCLFILIAGVLGTARITLRLNSLGEVLCGFTLGFTGALLVLHPFTNALFRTMFVY